MTLTQNQIDIVKAKIVAALNDPNTPQEVKDKIAVIARDYPDLGLKSEADLFNEAKAFFVDTTPDQWDTGSFEKYFTWVYRNRPTS